jgi:hypothetical protein
MNSTSTRHYSLLKKENPVELIIANEVAALQRLSVGQLWKRAFQPES